MSADFIGLDPDVDYEREYELKLHEMEELKHSYDEYVESSREFEHELETQLKQKDNEIKEYERRLQVTELKYKSIQDNYDRISADFTQTITTIQSLQSAVTILEENTRKLENENEDLLNKVRILEATEQDLTHKYNTAQEEIIFLKNDLENIQENKLHIENTLSGEIQALKEDIKRGISRRRRSLNKPDFGLDSLDFNTQETELLAQSQENLEQTVRELAFCITELETENADLQSQIWSFQAKKRLTNGIVEGSSLSLDDEVEMLKEEVESLREVITQKDNELAEMDHLKEIIDEKDERLRLIEKEFMEMLTPTFKAAKADSFYRMVPSSIKQNGSFLQIDSTTSVMGRLKSFLMTDDPEKLKKELIKMVGKYETERTHCAQLLNKIQTLQGNIVACCRTRPPSDQEIAAGGKIIVDTMDDSELMFYDSRIDSWKSFAFDRIWKADRNQVDVFEDVEPIIISVADGFNACVIAYGQTGSGKTYTMDGYGDQYGISYRTIQKLFEVLETKKSNKNGSNKNLLALAAKSPRETPRTTNRKEIPKNSATFEFVNPMAGSRRSSRLNVSSPGDIGGEHRIDGVSPATVQTHSTGNEPFDASIGAIHVETDNERSQKSGEWGSDADNISDYLSDEEDILFSYTLEISMMEIYNEQVYDLLTSNQGGGQTDGVSLELRTTPENLVIVPGLRQIEVHDMDEVDRVFSKGAKNRATASTNLNASSSRSHLITVVEVTVEETDGATTKGRLFLVDLAGSERIAKSGAKGQVLKEAQFINKSLSALGDVMEALDQKQKHIPFRNSKLTYLLQNALGGNSKTIMIFTVCPTDLTSDETLFTLQFAQRVRNISLASAQRNINAKNLEISVKTLKSELREVKKKKIALEELLVEAKKEAKKAVERSQSTLETKIRTLEDQKRQQEMSVQTLSKQIQDLTNKNEEEKNSRQQVLFDLELTQRNLKRALEVSKEYTSENDRLSFLLKSKEAELESLKEAVTKTILSQKKTSTAASSAKNNAANVASPPPPPNRRPSIDAPPSTPIAPYSEDSLNASKAPQSSGKVIEVAPQTPEIVPAKVLTFSEERKKEPSTEEVQKVASEETTHIVIPSDPSFDSIVNPPGSLSLSFSETSSNASPYAAMHSPSPLTKRLSSTPSNKLLSPQLVNVTSILEELEFDAAAMSETKKKETSLSVAPNITHKKINYERKPAIPRQSSSPSHSLSTNGNVSHIKRTDSHNSIGSLGSSHSHNSHASGRSTSSSRSSLTARSQEAVKKHQQRMEQKHLTNQMKGRIY